MGKTAEIEGCEGVSWESSKRQLGKGARKRPIMRLHEGTVIELNKAVLQNEIADRIGASYERYYRRRVNPSGYRAWQQASRPPPAPRGARLPDGMGPGQCRAAPNIAARYILRATSRGCEPTDHNKSEKGPLHRDN